MVGPMLLGYALGAVGIYALLYKFAPVGAEEAKATPTQVITLFEDEAPLRQAA